MSKLGSHNGDGIRYSLHLSAPKGGVAQMLRDPEGDWVPYEENARLKAEVERLKRAGDELVRSIEWRNVVIADNSLSFFEVKSDCLCNCHNFDEDIEKWNAAKEGKQP